MLLWARAGNTSGHVGRAEKQGECDLAPVCKLWSCVSSCGESSTTDCVCHGSHLATQVCG